MLCCVGDSNGWGWHPSGGRHAEASRWPQQLAKLLVQPLWVDAAPGRTLTFEAPEHGLICGIKAWRHALANAPSHLVLALGINDLAAGGTPQTIAQALTDYLQIWQNAGRPGQLILLAPAPIPALQGAWRSLFGDAASQAPALLPQWQQLAAAWQVGCVDPAPQLGPSPDGLHWQAEDHARVAEALAAEFARLA